MLPIPSTTSHIIHRNTHNHPLSYIHPIFHPIPVEFIHNFPFLFLGATVASFIQIKNRNHIGIEFEIWRVKSGFFSSCRPGGRDKPSGSLTNGIAKEKKREGGKARLRRDCADRERVPKLAVPQKGGSQGEGHRGRGGV